MWVSIGMGSEGKVWRKGSGREWRILVEIF